MTRILLVLGALCLLAPSAHAAPATASEPSYAFTIARVADGEVYFSGIDGHPWDNVSYRCGGCTFLVSKEGVRGPVEPAKEGAGTGVAFKLAAAGDSLDVTCMAKKCEVQTVSSEGKTKVQKIGRGHTESIVPSPGVKFLVVE